MSSAKFSQGLQSEKSSSRVLRPPGGGSSNIFGTDPVDYAAGEKKTSQSSSSKENIFGVSTENNVEVTNNNKAPSDAPMPTEDTENQENASKKQEPSEHVGAGNVPVSQTDGSPKKNSPRKNFYTYHHYYQGSFNPITGEAYEPAGAKAKASTKVRQPPGGKSSGLW